MLPRSETADAGGLNWCFRRLGVGPRVLLIHGTGSSSLSWLAVAQRLAPHFELLMPDLPGHGGSQGFADRRASLPRMADALAALLRHLGWAPVVVAGHSAGAAVMLQMVLTDRIAPAPRALLSLNGALQPLPGLAAQVFPPLARLLARSHWLPRWAAQHAARPASVQRLIASTGSRLDPPGVAHYQRLLSQESHVRGALDMMAHWQLDALRAALPRLQLPLCLAAGTADGTVPCQQSEHLAQTLSTAYYVALPGLGHLAHEEAPQAVADVMEALWRDAQPSPRTAADTACDCPRGKAK
ncbi:MAG: alpha/beta fold hydrolase BchO [Ideonella sp.]|nr:alpha/beta fold hydrolase BchO [Ideonella sp.]